MSQESSPRRKTYRQLELPADRRTRLIEETGVDAVILSPRYPCIPEAEFGRLIENYVGVMPVPLGLAENFVINGVETLMPMATEERTVIAAASHAAKRCRASGGFTAEAGRSIMAGQILFSGFADKEERDRAYVALHHRHSPFSLAKMRDWLAVELENDRRGRRLLETTIGVLEGERLGIVISLWFDTGETLGANFATATATKLAAALGRAIGREPTACICGNGSGRQTEVSARWSGLSERTMNRILDLQAWAKGDSNRAATENKGVLNGLLAVALATGQDIRALAAAVLSGVHQVRGPGGGPLVDYRIDGDQLVGQLNLVLPVATAGGATQHPVAAACRRLMGIENAKEMAEAMACVGLASSFSALRCLTEEGIAEAFRRVRQDG